MSASKANQKRPQPFVHRWERAVRDDATLAAMSKLLAHTMRTFANGDGTSCRPSVARLAIGMSANRRTVQRHLRELLQHGYIEEVSRGGGIKAGGHRGEPTVFRLVLPPFPLAGKAAESRPSKAAENSANGGTESGEQRLRVQQTAAEGRPTTTETTSSTTPGTTLTVREQVISSLRWATFRGALRDATGVLDDDVRLNAATTKIVNDPRTAIVIDDDIVVAVREAAEALRRRWTDGDVNPATLAREWPRSLEDALEKRKKDAEAVELLRWAGLDFESGPPA